METARDLELCSPKAVGIGFLISLKLLFKRFKTVSPWLGGALLGFLIQFVLIAGMFSLLHGFEKVFSSNLLGGVFLFTAITSSMTFFMASLP